MRMARVTRMAQIEERILERVCWRMPAARWASDHTCALQKRCAMPECTAPERTEMPHDAVDDSAVVDRETSAVVDVMAGPGATRDRGERHMAEMLTGIGLTWPDQRVGGVRRRST